MQSQDQSVSFFLNDITSGLKGVASRLSMDQRALLLNAIFTEYIKRQLDFYQWTYSIKEMMEPFSPESVRQVGQRLLRDMEQEKDDQQLGRLYVAAGVLADRLDPDVLNDISTHLIKALDRENSQAYYLFRTSLSMLKNRISNKLLHQGAEKLIEAARDPNAPTSLAETLGGLTDRLEAADVRKATEAIVELLEKNRWQYSNRDILSRLKLPRDRFTEEQARELAERLARVLDRAVLKTDVPFYGVERDGISSAAAIQNVAALLYRAPDQLLLDMLKRPYALASMREVVLRAWELKYDQHFEKDLWRFVAWAKKDPRTRNLDFGLRVNAVHLKGGGQNVERALPAKILKTNSRGQLFSIILL